MPMPQAGLASGPRVVAAAEMPMKALPAPSFATQFADHAKLIAVDAPGLDARRPARRPHRAQPPRRPARRIGHAEVEQAGARGDRRADASLGGPASSR